MLKDWFVGLVIAAAVANGAYGAAPTAFPISNHPKITAFDLMDQTDNHNELLTTREWTAQWNERAFSVACCALDVCDLETGDGRVFLRLAPLPHARPIACSDFRIDSRARKVEVLSNGYPFVTREYRGGRLGRIRAFHELQRELRPYVAGRDGRILSNNWGGGYGDSRLNEDYARREIEAGAKLGVEVIELDDGWQKGRSANSYLIKDRKKEGVWNGYWAFDPNFWDADPIRFAHGLDPLVALAKAHGMDFGLWFGPDSSNDAANWERDADRLLAYYRAPGIRYFKIDSMKSFSPLALRHQRAMFDKILAGSASNVVFDLDVTAEIRPGYFGLPDIGTLFVENRYAKHCSWWPHQTLKNLWTLSEVVDPVRMRMEFLDPKHLAELYAERFPGSPLRPEFWTGDAVFATVMLSSPLAWMELQGLRPETASEMAPVIATWKRERDRMHTGETYPVGAKPDGFSWTGFVVSAADGRVGYVLLFRECAKDPSFAIDLAPYLPVRTGCAVTSLAGAGTARLEGTRLAVDIPDKLGYVWVKVDVAELSTAEAATWLRARPVWPKGEADAANSACRLEADVAKADAPGVLKVTAAFDYKVWVNGEFAGFGPVRASEGVFHVDEWPLALTGAVNRVEIETAGYRCNSYYFLNQPSFVQAEIVAAGKVLAATGADGGFVARASDRIRKTIRYSGQRTFLDAWRVGEPGGVALTLEEQPAKTYRPRPVPYPAFAIDRSYLPIRKERLVRNPNRKIERKHYIEPTKDPMRQQFAPSELESNPFYELQGYDFVKAAGETRQLAKGESAIFEGDMNAAGFLGLGVRTKGPARVVIAFDEILTDKGELDFTRLDCANVAEWRIAGAGDWKLETFEPYAAKFIRVAAMEGSAEVEAVWVRTYVSPIADRADFESSDPALGQIFRAARASFRANSVDGLTDCPTRERAYWSGDTFFTGRASGWMAADGSVERQFLGNFLWHGEFDWSHFNYKCKGVDMTGAMPALFPGGIFWNNCIPNYMMWTILQAEEHVRRYGDNGFLAAAKARILAAIGFLERFRNSDGLLEKLPCWVFVEWSKANSLVQDVNYPSSMMYAAALEATARMYAMPELAHEAERIKREVVRQSWNGEWFCDNAVRQADGTLKLSGECTETCQYCAFFFRTVTPESHPQLWRRLLDEFGPNRARRGLYPKIWPCNFIFGTCERLELLSRAGRSRQIYDETRDFFLAMAERTGTLWEHLDTRASCCHGFCSIASEYLFRDILGVRELDRVNRTVRVEVAKDLPLKWCRGRLPVSAAETLVVSWRRENGGEPGVRVELPPGWSLKR